MSVWCFCFPGILVLLCGMFRYQHFLCIPNEINMMKLYGRSIWIPWNQINPFRTRFEIPMDHTIQNMLIVAMTNTKYNLLSLNPIHYITVSFASLWNLQIWMVPIILNEINMIGVWKKNLNFKKSNITFFSKQHLGYQWIM